MFFATGNEGPDQSHYLAGLPVVLPELNDNWVAVMALGNVSNLDMVWKAAYADSCGDAMNWCLAAPGTAVKSLRLGGGTRKLSGTSMAAPHVTGAILILKSQFDELTTKEIHQILFDTAVDIDVPGVDRVFGHGALNLNEALLPQGDMMVELGARVDQVTAPLSGSWIAESAIGCVFCVAHYSSSQTFAKVEAISASRSNAELPVIVCCSFIRGGPVFF